MAGRPRHRLDVFVADNARDWARAAADAVEAVVDAKPGIRLGVATGSTPLPLYRELVRRCTDLSGATVFLLDEYLALPPGHPTRYLSTVTELMAPLAVPPSQICHPDVDSLNLEDACRRYESELRERGGVDLQILGIGRNGHIGFNEPGAPLDSVTRVVSLTASTRAANRKHFATDQPVPTHAISQGIATILRARSILLLAAGPSKAAALKRVIGGPISTEVPASALQLHPSVRIIADEAAVN